MPICFIIRPEFHQWRCPDPFSTRLQGVCDKLGQSGDESSVYMVRRTPLKGHSRNLTIHNKLVNIISLKNACLDVTVVLSPDPHPRREVRTSKRLMLQSHATGMQDMFWPMPGLIICMDWGDETPWVSALETCSTVYVYCIFANLQCSNGSCFCPIHCHSRFESGNDFIITCSQFLVTDQPQRLMTLLHQSTIYHCSQTFLTSSLWSLMTYVL